MRTPPRDLVLRSCLSFLFRVHLPPALALRRACSSASKVLSPELQYLAKREVSTVSCPKDPEIKG